MLTHRGTQILTTERLTLRRFRVEDAKAMFQNWAGDSQVTKYLSWPTHEKVEDSRSVLESRVADYEKPEHYQWAIVLQGTEEPIGSIGAFSFNDSVDKVEVGYCIGQKWWNQGITSEALKAVMAYLFQEVGAKRIEAYHDTRNPASGAVMKKCGMEYEGTLRQAGKNNQGICDVCLYAAIVTD